MLRVLLNCPAPHDGTSFYRGVGPWSAWARKHGHHLVLDDGRKNDWVRLKGYDLIILQRPFSQDHQILANEAKAQGKGLIVDYDDDMLHAPIDMPQSAPHLQASIRQAVANLTLTADAVTLSTQPILASFTAAIEDLESRVYLVPNALDDDVFKEEFSANQDNKILAWRGGDSHVADALEFAESVKTVLDKHPDWQFHAFGWRPWPFVRVLGQERVIHTPWSTPVAYVCQLKKLSPAVMISTLRDDVFSHGRSNCGWLEATYCGSAVVGPDFVEWARPGISRFASQAEFIAQCDRLMGDAVHRNEQHAQSVQYIKDNLLLSRVNELRNEIVEKVMS